MTQTRRIILNVLATYGRSLFALICGIFTGRWVLEALGTQRYGVFGVVGVVLGLVGVINQILGASVGRYFAFAVGKAQKAGNSEEAIDESCGWFNTAVVIHTAIAFLMMVVGYPLGFWAIKCFFNIPPEMIDGSLWAFTFSMVTTFVGMVTVPYLALYNSHQYIAELTVYGICGTAANVICAWVLMSYPGDRLWFNAFYLMLIASVPNIIVAIRSFWVFPECRIRFSKMFDGSRYRDLFSFAGWQIFGWLGLTCRFQGLTALCNKVLGLEYNSSISVANTVSQHTMTFAYAMNGAFAPAITNTAGAGDRLLFEALVIRTCKFGTLMCAVFIIPLCLEIHYVIHLWLTTVPPQVEALCLWTFAQLIVDRMTSGFNNAIAAYGNIKWAEIIGGISWGLSLAVGCLFVLTFNMGVVGIAVAILVGQLLNSFSKIILVRVQLSFPVGRWGTSFVMPFVLVFLVSVLGGMGGRVLMEETFLRLVVTSLISGVLFVVGAFCFVCDEVERTYLREQVVRRIPWLKRFLCPTRL